MNKRDALQRRRTFGKTMAGLALVTALVIEMGLVGVFSRNVLSPAFHQQMSIDPGLCFRGW